MFRNREDAGRQLADQLQGRPFRAPLVLAIPRGGVVVGAVLARELGADLDVVLARKLRAPGRPELTVGAISVTGEAHLQPWAWQVPELGQGYLAAERRRQLAALFQRTKLLLGGRPAAPVAGRSVIVTDDGLATGSTMIAALKTVRPQRPFELIAAVPVGPPQALEEVRRLCDEVVYVCGPEELWSVGEFYEDFGQVEDGQVVDLLSPFVAGSGRDGVAPARDNPQPAATASR
jgi:predicted phosphoribosyltransferase